MAPTIKLILYLAFGGIFVSVGFNIHGSPSLVFLFLGDLCLALALAIQLKNHRVHGMKNSTANTLAFALFCSGGIGILIFWLQKRPEPKLFPHFTISLQIGEDVDTRVPLTNDFLFDRRVIKKGDLPHGKILYNSFVNGCLVIPVYEGESNKIFNFIAENDSPIKVNDLQLIVGFSKNLQYQVGRDWHKIEETFVIPKKMEA